MTTHINAKRQPSLCNNFRGTLTVKSSRIEARRVTNMMLKFFWRFNEPEFYMASQTVILIIISAPAFSIDMFMLIP